MKKSAMITNKESAFLAEAICADRRDFKFLPVPLSVPVSLQEIIMKQTKIPLTDEEKANLDLLKITDSGILTDVTDKEKLLNNGSNILDEKIMVNMCCHVKAY